MWVQVASFENTYGSDKVDRRDEFLRNWYSILWSNIDRSMTSIWQIVGTIALVGAAFIYSNKLGPHLTISLQLLIVFWAINNTMDMNAWHRRNLIFAARVETQFLHAQDYGTVIPSSFKEPRADWIEFYLINFVTFIVLVGVTIAAYLVQLRRGGLSTLCPLIGPCVIFVLGLIATLYSHHRCETQINRYLRETRSEPRS